ncbi:MAG TPA: alkaline phosphatase family protein [Verrucomicrobiae bacterium]|nr:alkaline phosphatase family protein [Verrucomicrobiae bacterium]
MRAALVLTIVALAGCSGGAAPAAPPLAQGAAATAGSRDSSYSTPIRHVVIIMQENRSFDNLFAGYPGADAPMYGRLQHGRIIPLEPVTFDTPDLGHGYGESITDYAGGKMDGFSQNYNSNGKQAGTSDYAYLQRSLVRPYWIMAHQYTLADKMFADEHGASWTAHLSIIGTTNISPSRALVDFPSNSPFDCFAPKGTRTSYITAQGGYYSNGPFPCFTQFRTMADTLDAAGVSWRYYTTPVSGMGSYWSPFAAVKSVRYGPDWSKVIVPPTTVLTDIAKGNLANVVWVTPDWSYSDHAGGGATMGPSWVSAVVNTIGQSKYWNSTAIVLLWDEWGGWYDDAPPPQITFKGLGLRVGCVIISPYARHDYVSHTQYQFSSVLHFVEQVFNLPPLGPAWAGYADRTSNSIIDSFDFTQTPSVFKTIPAPIPPSQFLKMRPSGRAPDDY